MKTVSQQFIDEQIKHVSKAPRCKIVVQAGEEIRDLTSYLVQDSLNRIEWRVEESLTAFGSPDIQFYLWYEQELWDWLTSNTNIEITVKKGFDFEKITRFTGFIDHDNLKQDTLGMIFVRAYSMSTKARSVTAGVPWWTNVLSVKDAVDYLFDQLGVSNQTIKVKPIDLEDHAWSEFYDENWGTVSDFPFGRIPIVAVSDHKFFFGGKRRYGFGEWRYTISLLEFNDDYSDYTVTTNDVGVGKTLVNIIRWGNSGVAAVLGDLKSFYYNDGGNARLGYDWICEEIRMFDFDLTQTGSHAITTYTSSGYKYHPLAKTVRRIGNTDVFVIAFNGQDQSAPYYVEIVQIQRRSASTNSVLSTRILGQVYVHPLTEAAAGYMREFGYYHLMFVCPITSYSANNFFVRYKLHNNTWSLQTGPANANAAQLEGAWAPCGQYVANDGGRVFDVYQCKMITSGWWQYFPSVVWTTKRDNKWYLTGFQDSGNRLMCKVYNENTGNYDSSIHTDVIPAGYAGHISPFSFSHEYDNELNFFNVMREKDSSDDYHHKYCMWGVRWFPFVTYDYTGKSVREVLDGLAKAFCCIYHFPDNDTGIFMSRDYLPDEEYIIQPILRLKRWYVTPLATRKIRVNGTEYGTGEKSLDITSDYIPDSTVIERGVGKEFFDFISEWNHRIEFKGDFLIQYEPLDMLVNLNPLDGYTYRGRIIRMLDENDVVKFVLRGKKQ